MSKRRSQDKEPPLEWLASFVHFFVLLFLFKSFFLPLFVIPTGSMAETLCGAHATHSCPNCGHEYQVGFHPPPLPQPAILECPNCRFRQEYNPRSLDRALKPTFGDRITVCPYEFGLGLVLPQRWDVVVFRNPQDPEMNYIKRMIGLPGETVEIIDGDIFIDGRIQRKPPHVQRSTWFPYYAQNYAPRDAGGAEGLFRPRWAAREADSPWTGLDARVLRCDAVGRRAAEIMFVSDAADSDRPGAVEDIYGYNPPVLQGARRPAERLQTVTDTRLSCVLDIEAGDGYFELSSTKFADRFVARIHADGRVELEHVNRDDGARATLATLSGLDLSRPHRVALACADYRAAVWVDGRPVLQSTDAQYDIAAEEARRRSFDKPPPELRLAAADVRAAVRDLRIERDIYYTSDVRMRYRDGADAGPGRATQGHPFELGPAEYFVLGDNSPNSADGRLWAHAGPHLSGPDSDYHMGAVPQDQLIGRAFMVYLPGFLPLPYDLANLVPDLGRLRWIH